MCRYRTRLGSKVDVQRNNLPRSISAMTLYRACRPEKMEMYTGGYTWYTRSILCIKPYPVNRDTQCRPTAFTRTLLVHMYNLQVARISINKKPVGFVNCSNNTTLASTGGRYLGTSISRMEDIPHEVVPEEAVPETLM